jgi:RNase adapter protein RapZ
MSTTSISQTELVLLTGMSGSGKSVALHALEDLGYYCVDNLPPELLIDLVNLEPQSGPRRLAIAVDVRSAASLPILPQQLAKLKAMGLKVLVIFLDAINDALFRRYSETRRRHPLTPYVSGAADQDRLALMETIAKERDILTGLLSDVYTIDTTFLRANQLQSYVKDLVNQSGKQLTLVFESFAFKRGVPIDADYVFDVRMLPNPYYEPHLRAETGLDEGVKNYLSQIEEVRDMHLHIQNFVQAWLPALARNHRSYVTVAIGCTGGQHRSVYLAEALKAHFAQDWPTLIRHREL